MLLMPGTWICCKKIDREFATVFPGGYYIEGGVESNDLNDFALSQI